MSLHHSFPSVCCIRGPREVLRPVVEVQVVPRQTFHVFDYLKAHLRFSLSHQRWTLMHGASR